MEGDNLQLGPGELILLLWAAGGMALALCGPGDGGEGRALPRVASMKAGTTITPHSRKTIFSRVPENSSSSLGKQQEGYMLLMTL